MLTPEESQELEACVQKIAAILYKNTPSEQLQTLESIEKTFRQHLLDHVSPKLAFFFINAVTGRRMNPGKNKEVGGGKLPPATLRRKPSLSGRWCVADSLRSRRRSASGVVIGFPVFTRIFSPPRIRLSNSGA